MRSIASYLRELWPDTSVPPALPVTVHSYDDVARLASGWRGVRRASCERLVYPTKAKTVIAIAWWPWVRSRRRQIILNAILRETYRRSRIALQPCFVTAQAHRRLQRAIDEAEEADRRRFDAERG